MLLGRPAGAVVRHLHAQRRRSPCAASTVAIAADTDLAAVQDVQDDHARERPLPLGHVVLGVDRVVLRVLGLHRRREGQFVDVDPADDQLALRLQLVGELGRVEPVALGHVGLVVDRLECDLALLGGLEVGERRRRRTGAGRAGRRVACGCPGRGKASGQQYCGRAGKRKRGESGPPAGQVPTCPDGYKPAHARPPEAIPAPSFSGFRLKALRRSCRSYRHREPAHPPPDPHLPGGPRRGLGRGRPGPRAGR